MGDISRFTQPDWYSEDEQLPSPLFDLAEVAARLGSPSAVRRDGRVIFVDKFDHLSWSELTTPAGYLVQLTNNGSGVYSPGTSLMLHPAAASSAVEVYKTFPYIAGRYIGAEIFTCAAFPLGVPGGATHTRFSLGFYDGANSYEGQLQINYNTGTVQIIDDLGAPHTLWTLSNLDQRSYQWLNIKLVIDVENKIYRRVMCNNNQVDASYGLVPSVAVGQEYYVELRVYNVPVSSITGYFDDFVLTIDEV